MRDLDDCRQARSAIAAPKLNPATIERTLEFVLKPVESGKDIADFGLAIVHAFAQAGAAKVETQDRPAETPIVDR